MKYLFVLAIFILSSVASDAQKQWTLEECINYAIDNNINLKQRDIQRQSDEVSLNTSVNSRLPNLQAGVNQNFGFGRSTDREGKTVDRNSSNLGLNLSTSVPVFTGFRITNDIASKRYTLEASTQDLEQAKNDISITIAQYFLQILMNKELVRVAQEQADLSSRQVTKTEELVNSGRASIADLYQAKSVLANDEASVTSAKTNLQLALIELAQMLELTEVKDFDVQAPILDAFEFDSYTLQHVDDVFRNALQSRPALRAAQFRLESAKRNVKVAQAGYYPTLNFNASVSDGYYYTYNQPDGFNQSFSDQLKNNLQESLGLSLSIPIFSRFAVRNSVRSAKLAVTNQNLVIESERKRLLKEIQQAYYNSVASRDNFIASEKATEASEIALQFAEEKYSAGRGTVYEFNDSKNRLIQSLSKKTQTKYEYIFRSKILDFYNGIPITLQ